jgi:hypothetical protein
MEQGAVSSKHYFMSGMRPSQGNWMMKYQEVPWSILKQVELKRSGKMIEYLITIEKAENNYAAYCQDLPGVIVTGPTRKETLEALMK